MSRRIGWYPRVRVEGGGRGTVSQAGAVLLVETVRTSGLDTAVSAAMAPWRKPRTVHDPGKILLDVALAVALGGDCLADIGMVRAEPDVFGPVASDPTVSRLVDALATAGPKTLAAIRSARAECLLGEAAGLLTPTAGQGPAAGFRRSGILHGLHLVRASIGARDIEATAHWITTLSTHIPHVQSIRCRALLSVVRNKAGSQLRAAHRTDVLDAISRALSRA